MLKLNRIYNMDCLDGMKLLDDNSVDSIVTDPPYELGFMGKEWDSTGIAYNVELWKECLRVLKPGGHLLAFGGTRTYHRMTCAIEDAGFEIRDCIQWIYGCLSEDTEILTLNGWERYHKAIEESPVICYNIDKDTFELHKPERSFIYENKHPAYRIKSDFTDQIVSRNHRCIVERGGRKVFAYAETLEQQESVPFLESLHDLPETIPYLHEGTSVTKQDLLERVRLQEYQQKQEGESNPLYGSEVCTMPRAVPTNGEERRLYYGTSVDRGAALGETVEADRSSTSYRSRSDQQRSCESYVVSEQQCSQEVRSYGKTRTTLATVEEVEYTGKMWCVQVPTGAFVARRNGQIFITGNSGFPKSHDISKAIDKKFGAEREVIGRNPNSRENSKTENNLYKLGTLGKTSYITLPSTDEAKQWDGWGTALKPANEPICVARKPISEKTIADNVLKWGTGGINIDGCRIGTEQIKTNGKRQGKGVSLEWSKYTSPEGYEGGIHQGRFPANVILDEEAGKLLDEQSGILKSAKVKSAKPAYEGESITKFLRGRSTPNNQYDDCGGASRFFYCAKASKKERGEGNNHPTVKPLSLIKYLITLVTPPGGICLDPFEGSGTHALACKDLGFNYIGFELDKIYYNIATKRINA